MQKPDMDHMVICATDVNKSLGFYSTVLGAFGFKQDPRSIFKRDSFVIQIKQAVIKNQFRGNREPGVNHIGFRAPSREYVERMIIALENAGFSDCDIIDFDDGAYALFIEDPDGFRIELCYYPDSEARID